MSIDRPSRRRGLGWAVLTAVVVGLGVTGATLASDRASGPASTASSRTCRRTTDS